MAYICSNSDNNHKCRKTYATPTADYFCLDCGYDGLLIASNMEDASIPEMMKGAAEEIGLCVLLMDASGSMDNPAFEGSPLTKMRLIAINAAQGIFELKPMSNPEKAYICAFKFDDKVKQMFFKTVKQILDEYQTVEKFADYLYTELLEMQGTTDIIGALQAAYSFVDKFLNKSIPNFQDYTPLEQVLYTKNGEQKVIPNTRVLLYTDGQQYLQGVSSPLENPFKNMSTDILIGAFFGQHTDAGCAEFRAILSPCPQHGFEQFFLFDSPTKSQTLRKLFRMASGASGFCPLCIPNRTPFFASNLI